jgi:prepilin signal peptidase PulO-like enzyme (type II secretory pathway)
MLGLALAASVTDLRRGAIPNALVRRGLWAAAIVWAAVAGSTTAWWPLGAALPAEVGLGASAAAVATNAAFGVVVSVLLYAAGLWAAGDAKLAIALAAAQPAWVAAAGPLPWAPFSVVLGNTFAAAVALVAFEAAARRGPAAARALRVALRERRFPVARAAVADYFRMALATAALMAAISPLRRLAGGWAAGLVSGGHFLALLALVVAYRPLRRLVATRGGVAAVAVVFGASAVFTVATGGAAGLADLGRSLLFALAATAVLGALGAASRPLDARPVAVADLAAGMVLADSFLDRLEVERRWAEAFAPILGSLRGVRLDDNLIANLREWHAHNAPGTDLFVRSHVPFAPAFALGVLLTALLGRLAFLPPPG